MSSSPVAAPPASPAGWSLSLGTTPTTLGTLGLAPPILVLLTSNLDAAGQAQLPIPIPNLAPLVGLDVHFQSVEDNTAGLTGTHLISVVESVRLRL